MLLLKSSEISFFFSQRWCFWQWGWKWIKSDPGIGVWTPSRQDFRCQSNSFKCKSLFRRYTRSRGAHQKELGLVPIDQFFVSLQAVPHFLWSEQGRKRHLFSSDCREWKCARGKQEHAMRKRIMGITVLAWITLLTVSRFLFCVTSSCYEKSDFLLSFWVFLVGSRGKKFC